jgi:hypothetical protein
MDESKPASGEGRGADTELQAPDPEPPVIPGPSALSETASLPAVAAQPVLPIAPSPTRAIRRRARVPSLSPEAAVYAAEAYASTTIAAYEADCAHFEQWCKAEGRVALPADLDTVTRYIVAHGELLGRGTLALIASVATPGSGRIRWSRRRCAACCANTANRRGRRPP